MVSPGTPKTHAAIRLIRPTDSMVELTDMIHRAFAPLAEAGMSYLGSYQDEAMTRWRCGRGECWVAEGDGRLVGTITWRHDPMDDEPVLFLRREVAVFGQLAVDPALQRHGLGGRLLDTAERRAREKGYEVMACDTAVPNRPLIDFYLRRGYRVVGTHQWSDTNYESAILTKPLISVG